MTGVADYFRTREAPPCAHPLRQTTARPAYVYCWACRRELRGAEAWMVQRRWDSLGPSLADFFRVVL